MIIVEYVGNRHSLDRNALNLVERNLIITPVVVILNLPTQHRQPYADPFLKLFATAISMALRSPCVVPLSYPCRVGEGTQKSRHKTLVNSAPGNGSAPNKRSKGATCQGGRC